MDLQTFARERIKMAAGKPWAKSIWEGAKGLANTAERVGRWSITTPMHANSKSGVSAAKKILGKAKNMDAYDRAMLSRIARGAAPVDTKFLNRMARKHDVRELSAIKPLMMGAIPAGVIAGAVKGQKEYRQPAYHGPMYERSPQIYQDPSRLLV